MKDCPFCEKPLSDILIDNEYAKAFKDIKPVNPGHTLIVPKRHVENWWYLTETERIYIDRLIVEVKKILDKEYHPSAYNIGMNLGVDAGQTVFHAHVHLIPRYKNDTDERPVLRPGVKKLIKRKI